MDKIDINLNDLKRQSVDKDREEETTEDETVLEEDLLQESDLEAFGSQIQLLLQRMFGMNSLPVSITGNKSDIQAFAGVMGREKSYVEKIKEYGLDNPKVVGDKYRLKQAISSFERDTGIAYPFSSR